MFENFSFRSNPSHGATSPPVSEPSSVSLTPTFDDSIELISPFSSRAASPFPSIPQYPLPTSTPRQLSITSLTHKLHAHSLYQTSSAPTNRSSYYSYHSSEDEGYSDPDSDGLPTPPLSALDSPTSAAYFDLPPTSNPSLSLTRRNRGLLQRLQCSVKNAVHLAMLIEEQHPSSLPLGDGISPPGMPADVSPERRRVSVASARKVQKSNISRKGSVASLKAQEMVGTAVVKKGIRMRRGTGASGAGRR